MLFLGGKRSCPRIHAAARLLIIGVAVALFMLAGQAARADAPTMIAETADTNADGTVDQLTITFSENVLIVDGVAGNGLPSLSLTDGCTIDNGDYGSVSTSSLVLPLSGCTSNDTSITPTLTYTSVASCLTLGGICDLVGLNTQMLNGTGALAADGAAPIPLSVTYQDGDNDAYIDRFTFTFSETLDSAAQLSANDLALSNVGDFTGAVFGTDATDLATGGSSSLTVPLGTEATVQDTSDDSGSLALQTQNNFSLEDTAGNVFASLGALGLTPIDGAAPVPITASVEDTDADGDLDQITLGYSENLNVASDITGGWDLTSASDFGSITETDADCNTGLAGVDECVYSFTTTTKQTSIGDLNLTYTSGNGVTDGVNGAISRIFTSASSPTSLFDAAPPILLTAVYQDDDSDGRIDQVVVTSSVDTGLVCTSFLGGTDFDFTTPGDISLSAAVGDTCATNGTDTITLTLANQGDAGETGGATDPVLEYVQPGDGIEDALGNDVPSVGAIPVLDGAPPILLTAQYEDGDGDGRIDQFTFTSSETMVAASVLAASDMLVTNVGDFTGITFGASATDQISANTTTVTVPLGTEATAVTTQETSGNLEISLQNNGALQDTAGNIYSTHAVLNALTMIDGAAPVSVGAQVRDTDNDGHLDRVSIQYSEALRAISDATADYHISSAADFSGLSEIGAWCNYNGSGSRECMFDFSTSTERTNIADLTLTYTAGTSVIDDEGNIGVTYSFNASSVPTELVDSAGPVMLSGEYRDANEDGQVDRIVVTTSIDTGIVCTDFTGGSDLTFSNAGDVTLATSLLDSCASNGTNTMTFDLANGGASLTTGGASAPIMVYAQPGNGIEDVFGNDMPSLGSLTLSDGAAPLIRTATYQDADGNGRVDQLTLAFTEDLAAGSVLSASDIGVTSAGDFTGLASGAGVTDLVTGSVSSIAVPLTESSVVDTSEDTGTFAIASANNLSLVDASANTYTTLGAQAQVTVIDGAAPVVTSVAPSDGGITTPSDHVFVTFSEPMDTIFAKDVQFATNPDVASWTATWSNGNRTVELEAGALLTCGLTYAFTTDHTQINASAGSVTGLLTTGPVDGDVGFFVTGCGSGSSGAASGGGGGGRATVGSNTPSDSSVPEDTSDQEAEVSDETSALDTLATPSVPLSEGLVGLVQDPSTSPQAAFDLLVQDFVGVTGEIAAPLLDIFGVSPLTLEQEPISEVRPGDLIRGEHYDALYFVDTDGVRHPFFNETHFKTWRSNFDGVRVVTDATLASVRLGPPVPPKPQAVLVKAPSVPYVYYVLPGENPFSPEARWIPDEATAILAFGEDWAQYVVDVPEAFLARYQKGPEFVIE